MGTGNLSLSVIIPLFNEKGNVGPLYEELNSCLSDMDYEIILVDDGSKDGTKDIAEKIALNDKHVKLISLSGNFGQSAAFQA